MTKFLSMTSTGHTFPVSPPSPPQQVMGFPSFDAYTADVPTLGGYPLSR